MLEGNVASLTLVSGDMRLGLNPALGGSISSLRWKEHDVMRSTPPGTSEITEMASFPLVPIVNRIPEGKFTFEGQSVDLEGNFLGLADFIHGFGWREAWTVVSKSPNSAALSFHYPAGGAWPWPFEARQKFQITDKTLRVELSVRNLSDKNMPADLGFHPFFPTTPNTRLFADYEGHWVNNELGHAVKRVVGSYRQDFTQGSGLNDPVMTDQTHYGWRGEATLKEIGRPDIRIIADKSCRNLHVFFPPNGNYVAIEPTRGRGNPFGVLPQEYRILSPNEESSIWMQVDVIGGGDQK